MENIMSSRSTMQRTMCCTHNGKENGRIKHFIVDKTLKGWIDASIQSHKAINDLRTKISKKRKLTNLWFE